MAINLRLLAREGGGGGGLGVASFFEQNKKSPL